MTIVTEKITFDTPNGMIEDAEVTYHVRVTFYPAEPTSWGRNRGQDCEAEARLMQVKLGRLTLSRANLAHWIDEEPVTWMETRAAQRAASAAMEASQPA